MPPTSGVAIVATEGRDASGRYSREQIMSEGIKKTGSRAEAFLAATVEVLKRHYQAGRL